MTTQRPAGPPAIAVIAACPFPTHQGTQVFVRHLVNGLASRGVRISLFTYDVGEPLDGVDLHPSILWYRVPAKGVGLRSGPSLARVKADAELLTLVQRVGRKTPFDTIHAHNAEGLAIGAIASRLLDVPLVYHAHSALGLELASYAASRPVRAIANALGQAFDLIAPRTAKTVITFDERQRDYHMSLGATDVHVIPPGLAMDELGGGRASGRYTLIYAGNPDGYQNLDLLRATFFELRQDEPWWRLRILSNHPRDAFGDLTKDAGVEVVGYSGPKQLGDLLRTGSVGISTRTLWVGAPIKVLTYISAGLPVVACANGAHILADFPDAAILTEANVMALADAVRRSHALNATRAREALDLAHQLPLHMQIIAAQRGARPSSHPEAPRGRRAKAKATRRPARAASPSPQ